MKVKTVYIIELDFEDAVALKILLGKESDITKKASGLNDAQCKFTSELYNSLPDAEEN